MSAVRGQNECPHAWRIGLQACERVADGCFPWTASKVYCFFCGFLRSHGFHGGGFAFGRGSSHHGFGAPEVGGDFCDFVGRIADIRREAIESGFSSFDGVGVDLLEFS